MSLHLPKCHIVRISHVAAQIKIEPAYSIRYMLTCANNQITNQFAHPYRLMGVLVFTLAKLERSSKTDQNARRHRFI